MSPSKLSWAELLARPNVHPAPAVGWISCSVLPKLEDCSFYENVNESSDAARRGTALHAIMSGEVECPSDIPVTEATAIRGAEIKLEDVMSKYGYIGMDYETEAIGSNGLLRIQGTMDFRCENINLGQRMILDYKFGNKPVDSNSIQLAGYVCLWESESKIADGVPYHVGIIQPGHETKIELMYPDECHARIMRILTKRTYNAGRHCRYCKNIVTCPSVRHAQKEVIVAEATTSGYTKEQLATILDFCNVAQVAAGRAEKLRAGIRDYAHAGNSVPGYAIKEIASKRVSDPMKLIRHLEATGMDRAKIMSAMSITIKALKELIDSTNMDSDIIMEGMERDGVICRDISTQLRKVKDADAE